jgi:hypothetical protein
MDFARLAIAFGDEMNRILQGLAIKSPRALNVFPSMHPSHVFSEDVSYHKRNTLVSLRFNVPSLGWAALAYAEKVDRLCAKVCENVARIKDGVMSSDDKEILINAVGAAREKLRN